MMDTGGNVRIVTDSGDAVSEAPKKDKVLEPPSQQPNRHPKGILINIGAQRSSLDIGMRSQGAKLLRYEPLNTQPMFEPVMGDYRRPVRPRFERASFSMIVHYPSDEALKKSSLSTMSESIHSEVIEGRAASVKSGMRMDGDVGVLTPAELPSPFQSEEVGVHPPRISTSLSAASEDSFQDALEDPQRESLEGLNEFAETAKDIFAEMEPRRADTLYLDAEQEVGGSVSTEAKVSWKLGVLNKGERTKGVPGQLWHPA
jgi:hypothetical protein